jgi:hypothetical protein
MFAIATQFARCFSRAGFIAAAVLGFACTFIAGALPGEGSAAPNDKRGRLTVAAPPTVPVAASYAKAYSPEPNDGAGIAQLYQDSNLKTRSRRLRPLTTFQPSDYSLSAICSALDTIAAPHLWLCLYTREAFVSLPTRCPISLSDRAPPACV